jgi:hypothetical protein
MFLPEFLRPAQEAVHLLLGAVGFDWKSSSVIVSGITPPELPRPNLKLPRLTAAKPAGGPAFGLRTSSDRLLLNPR